MNKKLLLRLAILFSCVLIISATVIYLTFDIRT